MEAVTVYRYTCQRCGHVWQARKPTPPTVCPTCKSPYWQTPRKRPAP